MGRIDYIYLAREKRQAVERVDKATLEAGKGRWVIGTTGWQRPT